MAKLIIHTGNAPASAYSKVVGDITKTPKQMSDLGRALRSSEGPEYVSVFTNSDHVINGVRLAVRNNELLPCDVVIFFYNDDPQPEVTKINISLRGSLSEWPVGFMDQIEKDLYNLR